MITKISVGNVEPEISGYIQALDYELQASQRIVCSILKETPKVDSEMFEEYKKEYEQAFFKFKAAQAEFEVNQVRTRAPKNVELRQWWLDYLTGEITVEVSDSEA